jgi:hypothetical protein
VPAPDVNNPPFATVSALVPGAAGSWNTYAGTFTASGSFSIPNVPAGTYLLSFTDGSGVHTLVETASSTVDLGYDVLGRSDATRPAASTPVTLDVSGLTAWDPSGDQVQITSSNADAWDVPIRGAQLAPLATATPVPGIVDDWFASASGGALNLLAAPDVLYVHDLATTSATRAVALTTHPYQYAASWTSVTGTALTSGTPATINTALTAAPQTGYVAGSAAQALDWSLSLFEAQLPGLIGTAIAPAGSTHTLAVGASAHPLTNPAPVAVGSPILFQMSLPAGTGDFATTASLAYGQFLDATLWNEWRRIDFSAPVSYSAPLSTVALIDEAMLGRAEPMSPTVPTPIVPTLGPVQSPLVNGTLGAFASLAGVTTTPTLSWSAPALGGHHGGGAAEPAPGRNDLLRAHHGERERARSLRQPAEPRGERVHLREHPHRHVLPLNAGEAGPPRRRQGNVATTSSPARTALSGTGTCRARLPWMTVQGLAAARPLAPVA